MVLTYRSPVKLDLVPDATSATARGDFALLFEVLAAKRILADLSQADGIPTQGWSDGQLIPDGCIDRQRSFYGRKDLHCESSA